MAFEIWLSASAKPGTAKQRIPGSRTGRTGLLPDQLESAIGAETLEALTKQTGLSREEVLSRLTRELPNAVDKYTPEGQLPTEDGVQRPV